MFAILLGLRRPNGIAIKIKSAWFFPRIPSLRSAFNSTAYAKRQFAFFFSRGTTWDERLELINLCIVNFDVWTRGTSTPFNKNKTKKQHRFITLWIVCVCKYPTISDCAYMHEYIWLNQCQCV